VEGGLQLADALQVHDGRAVDAHEPGRVELPLQRRQRLAQQVVLLADVQADVVARGLDPVDVLDADEVDAPAGFDHQALGAGAAAGGAPEQLPEALAQGRGAPLPDLRLGALQGGGEAAFVERLEQVIQGVHLERLQRVAVVGGDEDDRGRHRVAQGLQDAEAVQAGHLHVQEHQVGAQLPQGAEGLLAVAAFAEDGDVRVGFEQPAQPLPRQRFVVHDEGADRHATSTAGLPAAACAAGSLGCGAGS
jgi:hypothetical protein